jgi:hypothetical protein
MLLNMMNITVPQKGKKFKTVYEIVQVSVDPLERCMG